VGWLQQIRLQARDKLLGSHIPWGAAGRSAGTGRDACSTLARENYRARRQINAVFDREPEFRTAVAGAARRESISAPKAAAARVTCHETDARGE